MVIKLPTEIRINVIETDLLWAPLSAALKLNLMKKRMLRKEYVKYVKKRVTHYEFPPLYFHCPSYLQNQV